MQDQIVVKLDLRREDPENPGGDSAPDITGLDEPNPVVASHLIGICEHYGFDPALSTVSVLSVTDSEGPTPQAISLADLASLGAPPV
jgi:hypothetical protein